MDFFSTIEEERVNNMWLKLNNFLEEKLREDNPSFSDTEIEELTKEGLLTIKWQNDTDLDFNERQEYLVLNFGTQEDINSFNKWKEVK